MNAAQIREICAKEFGGDPNYPFFHACYLPDEPADVALERMFREERAVSPAEWDDEHIVMILIYG